MILLHKERIERTLKRMAYQIVEEAKEEKICLIGLNVRGYAVAKVLSRHIQSQSDAEPMLLNIDADGDTPFEMPGTVDHNTVLALIDDVVFSGITMYRAMQKIPGLDRYKNVHVATLVDRGHRRLPIEARITGMHVPTKLNEHVELIVERGIPKKVLLTSKN